jgi:hypothetical protein
MPIDANIADRRAEVHGSECVSRLEPPNAGSSLAQQLMDRGPMHCVWHRGLPPGLVAQPGGHVDQGENVPVAVLEEGTLSLRVLHHPILGESRCREPGFFGSPLPGERSR